MTPEPEIDLDAAAPAAVFEAVARMDDEEFAALMDDPATRPRVIAALVDYFADHFRGDRAGDLEAVIHVKLWDRPEGGYDHYELRIADGACVVSDAPENEPDLTLKVRPEDLRAIVTGETGPRRLALKGRLRVLGDLGLGMKLGDLFTFESG